MTFYDRKIELQQLRAQAKEIQKRLEVLETRISRIGQRKPLSDKWKAFVDEGKCVGCTTCEKTCPTHAIKVDKVAQVDETACIGCGWCVGQCPKGAIRLRPWREGEKVRKAIRHGIGYPKLGLG